ncbi:chromate efflux transporter [Methylophaga sp. OBS3]|uniref:chromate efflux transporter n=1 Tax=Methylophaga sp. OBS3 TaxID=2991934 RepID=UPI002255505A|nr:chromate efflux transporter [Methylophaga sp. OBS3]MCX4188759.1 chromate efflux transporter [Methylophaga sp. OBS3]
MSENQKQSPLTIFLAFLKLGFTAFGGPIAHIGFYREAFVKQRQWLDEKTFAQLLAACQFLPGPASSQMGFSIGLVKGGWLGAIAAFIAFTLPSALALFAFASFAYLLDGSAGQAIIHGLKLVAVAVVAHAVWGMAQKLTPDWPRRIIAVLSFILLISLAMAWLQLAVILLGAVLGLWLCKNQQQHAIVSFDLPYQTKLGWLFLALFLIGLIFSITMMGSSPTSDNVFAAFYQSGALVFGGGHVVLPLLEQTTVANGWVTTDTFLSGYGAAQAVPGPLFTLSTYLGANIDTGMAAGWTALIATVAIFLPGFLLLLAVLPFWAKLAEIPKAGAAIAGVNAAVVGLLAAALYQPIITQTVHNVSDVVIALGGFLIVSVLKRSALWTVFFCVLASVLFNFIA